MFIPLIYRPIRFMIAFAFNLTLALGLAWVVSFLYSKSSNYLVDTVNSYSCLTQMKDNVLPDVVP